MMPTIFRDNSSTSPVLRTKTDRHLLFERSRPVWQEFSQFYHDERDCLAAFLALESAEILERTKPANLVNVVNKRRPCGRNLYRLWKEHGSDLVRDGSLVVKELADRGDSILLFLYHPGDLASLLARKSVSVILRKAGYTEPENLDNSLAELQSRLSGTMFPHEIGIFLGYPLKDVVGFMGWTKIPFTCQGPWKIYGNPKESIKLAEIHLRSRRRMAHRLRKYANPLVCLKVGVHEGAVLKDDFFDRANDNDNHYSLESRLCA